MNGLLLNMESRGDATMNDGLYIKVEKLKYLLVSHATGEDADDAEYKDLRQELIRNTYINSYLPKFLRDCRSLTEFWGHIKNQSPTYQGRRDYLRDEFNHALTIIEESIITTSPVDSVVSDTIDGHIDYEYVQQVWQKALVRRTTDPDGAITIARTLLEATCKHIMDEAEYEYNDKAELPQLYKGVQELLNLAPSEHTEQIFKEILSGCVSVVKGLGSLRNKLSDAHGRSRKVPSPSSRHAQFAVNIAGSTAEFLISSWEEKKGRESK